MQTQRAWLLLTLLILLLTATLAVLSTYSNCLPISTRVVAAEKVETPFGMVHIDPILTYSPSTRMRLQQVATGPQAAQAGRQTVAHFRLQNVAGGFMTSEDLKGKVAVIDIWATWCHWCAEEVPIYNQLYDAFLGRDDVAIVGIVVDSPRRDIQSKVRELGMKYPVLIGDDGALQPPYGPVQGLPTTLVMSKEGEVYKHYRGAVPQKEQRIKQDIQELLAEESH